MSKDSGWGLEDVHPGSFDIKVFERPWNYKGFEILGDRATLTVQRCTGTTTTRQSSSKLEPEISREEHSSLSMGLRLGV